MLLQVTEGLATIQQLAEINMLTRLLVGLLFLSWFVIGYLFRLHLKAVDERREENKTSFEALTATNQVITSSMEAASRNTDLIRGDIDNLQNILLLRNNER